MSSHVNSFSSPPVPHQLYHLNYWKQYINKASKKQSYMNSTAQNVFLPIPHISVLIWLTPTLANQTRNKAKWEVKHHGLAFFACARKSKSFCSQVRPVLKPYCCTCVCPWNTFIQGKIHEITCRKMQRQDLSLQVKHSKKGWLLKVRQEARRK